MRNHFLVALLIFASTSTVYASETKSLLCELEAKTPAQAVVGLILIGHKLQLFKVVDLQTIAAATQAWENPFLPFHRSLDGHALFKGFHRVSRLMKEQDWETSRQLLTESIIKLDQNHKAESQAREQTKHILRPTLFRTLTIPGQESYKIPISGASLIHAFLDGRPIFVGNFDGGGDKKALILFDPFHSDKSKQAEILSADFNEATSQHMVSVERDGATYLVSLDKKFVIDLRTRKKISAASFGLDEIKPSYRSASYVAQTAAGPKFIEVRDGKHLHVHDWTGASKPMHSGVGLCEKPSFFAAGGRHFVTCVDAHHMVINIFSVESEAYLTPIQLTKSAYFLPHMHSIVYENRNELYIATLIQNSSLEFDVEEIQLGLRENKRFIATVPKADGAGTFVARGETYFFAEGSYPMVAGKINGGPTYPIELTERTYSESQFTWREERYLWRTDDSGLFKLYSMTDGKSYGSYRTAKHINYNQTFIYQGLAYALIGGDVPELILLTSEEDKP